MATKTETTVPVALVLDFETGGLDCRESACTQIAIHAVKLDTFEKTGSFVRYIRPYEKKELAASKPSKRKVLKTKYELEEENKPQLMGYEDRALEYSDISMDTLYAKGEDITQVADDILKFIADHTPKSCSRSSKPFIIGQNIGFDEGFLCQLFEYAGKIKELQKLLRGHTDFYGHWHPLTLDTIVLGQMALCHRSDINSYKLEIMCENLGIELDDAHDADADVAATSNVAAVLAARMRNGESGGSEIQLNKAEKTRKHFKI